MKKWIQAARLRTLPLSVSGIFLGSASIFAYDRTHFSGLIFALALITTLGFQVLSNFANDYGDGIKGTDNADRIGPVRALQSGAISASEMKKAIIITAIGSFVAALTLIYVAFKNAPFQYALFFIVLGILAIAAAIKYTVGSSAYGYKGFGDVFVFIFFGWISTLGVSFLYTQYLIPNLFLPATAIGFLSVGVLNLNNMRDEESDKKAGKNTLVVQLGAANAKKYHYFLVLAALVLVLIFAFTTHFKIIQFFFVLAFIPLLKHVKYVIKNREPRLLDSQLKVVAIHTFLLSIVLSLCMIL